MSDFFSSLANISKKTCPLTGHYQSTYKDYDGISIYKSNKCIYGLENTNSFKVFLLNLSVDERFNLFSLLNEYCVFHKDKIPVVLSNEAQIPAKSNDYEFFRYKDISKKFPSLGAISLRVLKNFAKKAQDSDSFEAVQVAPHGGAFTSTMGNNYESFFSRNFDHITSTIGSLKKEHYVSVTTAGTSGKILRVTLTEEGLTHALEAVDKSSGAKKSTRSTQIKPQCFVAMKFGKMADIVVCDSIGVQSIPLQNLEKAKKDFRAKYNLELCVKDKRDMDKFYKNTLHTLVESELKIKCVRVDKQRHTKIIVEKIKEEIDKSKFLICDLTYHNQGVYFEAGYAVQSGKPIIYICEQSHYSNIHFDVKHINIIQYDKKKPDALKKAIRETIKEEDLA